MVWHVYLYGIQWGDCDGAELPENLLVAISCDDKTQATELALAVAAKEYACDVAETEQIIVKRA